MPYKLLLADDSVTIQRVIELTFADEDVKVTAVGDGQAAIDRIAMEPPDIVLADVGMPARDGYEVAAFVKNDPALAHIPVLLLTGAFEPVDEARASAVRCDGVLAKPFEPQLLIGRVRELLGAVGKSPAQEPVAAEVSGVFSGQTTSDSRDLPDLQGAPARDDDDTGPLPVAASAGGYTPEDFSLDTASIGEASSATPAADVSLDDYFDRLDAAFANLSGAPAGQLKGAVGGDDTSWAPPSAGAWSAADPGGLATPARTAAGDQRPSGSVPVAAREAAPVSAPIVVPVADAFAALLEAEQHGAGTPPAPGEVTMPGVSLGAPVVTDALVDAVVDRVVQRLGGGSLQDAVARVVLETAERLVRQEIERLKAAAR
jgi:CheY-like chemotaxis protein